MTEYIRRYQVLYRILVHLTHILSTEKELS
jgi:hypothetical protein